MTKKTIGYHIIMMHNVYRSCEQVKDRGTVCFSSTAGGAALSAWYLDLRLEGDSSGEPLRGKDCGSCSVSISMMFVSGRVSTLS